MKKILIAFFACVLCFAFCGICAAENNPSTVESAQREGDSSTGESEQGEAENSPSVESEGEERDLKEYITDKILPIIIGVATSSFGFVAVLGTISRTLKSLKDTKESFSSEAKKRQEAFDKAIELLKEKTDELEELVRDVPQLKEHLDGLAQEEELLAEILTLGFSANSEIIKSGKGKKMAILLENAKSKALPQSPAVTAPSYENPKATEERLEDPYDGALGKAESEGVCI